MSERLQPPVAAAPSSTETCPACGHESASSRCDGCGAALRVRSYRIERVLGRGGQGRVYLARGADGRAVALKELAFASAPDAATIDAFTRETALLRELNHPQVPRFHESFSEGAGVHLRLYQVQEHIEGKSLLERIAEGPLSHDEVRDLARQLLEVLAVLHGREPPVVHRDLKPGNVLLRPDGRVMLVDFGVARTLERGATHGSTLVGTFGYAAPEQLGGTVSPASDLYSLGATLAHALLRKPPDAWISETLELRFAKEPALRGFETFLGGLLQRRPEHRFPSAAEALKALAKPPPRRTRRLVALAAAGALAIAALSAGLWARQRATPPAPTRPAPIVQLQPTSRHLGEVFERLRAAKTPDAKAAALQELTYGDFSRERLPDDAQAVITPMLEDADAYVRRMAFTALRHPQLRVRALFPTAMAHAKKETDLGVQGTAATAAGEILSHAPQDAETEAMADELVEFVFTNPEGDAQIFAGAYVSTIHPLSAKGLKTIRAYVRSGKGKGQHLAMLFGHLPALHIDEREAVELMGSKVGDDRHLGIGAAGLLTPSPAITTALGRLAAEDSDNIRRADALMVLEKLAPPPHVATPVFVQALRDEDPSVRETAARALGAMGPSSAEVRAALQPLENDPEKRVSAAAKAALEELGRRAGR